MTYVFHWVLGIALFHSTVHNIPKITDLTLYLLLLKENLSIRYYCIIHIQEQTMYTLYSIK